MHRSTLYKHWKCSTEKDEEKKKINENGNQNKRNERNMRCFKNEKQIKFDEFYV